MPGTIVVAPPSSLMDIEGSGELEYSADGLTGTRKARVLSSDLPQALGFLLGTITKSSSGGEIVNTAQPWPGIPSLLVSRIRATPSGRSGLSSWTSAVLPHQYMKLDITYTTTSLQKLNGQDADKEKPENEDYLIQNVSYTCETVQVPVKVTDTNASSVSTTREVKANIRLPRIEYSITIPKVRFPDFALIRDLNGKINTKKVFGGDPGTVLFDAPTLSNTISSLGDPAWKFDAKFIYNKFGWNNALHPETLKWVPVVSLDGGTVPPYASGDLSQLWTRIKK